MDVSTIDLPTFVMGAVNDHLTPWRGTYRTTEMTAGPTTFVLSNAGHIAALVNPPGNPKASYFVGEGAGAVDADTWRENARQKKGSWWQEWAGWMIEYSGAKVVAPKKLGSPTHPLLTPAPGLYVKDQISS